MTRWYYSPNNKQRLGPVSTEQMRQLALSGALSPEHMVMREGGRNWVLAAKVKGLFSEPSPAKPPPAPALTACCPGCGRAIPLNGPHELTLTLQCARCNTRFVPAHHSAPQCPSAPTGGSASPKAARSWAGTALAALALMLGVAAMPVAVIYNPFLGAGLAALGVLLGGLGLLVALTRRGAGCGFSFAGTAVCGSILFAALVLLAKSSIPDDRRAQAETAKQAREDTAALAKKSPNERETGPSSGKTEVSRPDTGKVGPSGTDNQKPAGPRDEQSPGRPGTIRVSGRHADRARTDIDLWMDNPVEADTRWVGKVVEVEMNVGDLRITTHEDKAGLDTPPDELWGRFWQPAFFVFRGDARKQLVGLQNLSGVLVIRGRCRGLQGRYATFDNCEIVEKPKGAEAAKQEGKKPGSQDKPQFDPNDFERTGKWAAVAATEMGENRDNAIRLRASLDKFNEDARAYSGKKVRWSLEVTMISDSAVVFPYMYRIRSVSSGLPPFLDEFVGPYLELENKEDRSNPVPQPGEDPGLLRLRDSNRELELDVGRGISRDQAARLHPGDKITVTAEVVSVTMETGECNVKVRLKNLRAEDEPGKGK
jgi:hypothetical protein